MSAILQQHFTACYHVDRVDELPTPAKDAEIWNFAERNDLIIVTNDEDFIDFMNVKGFPPKVVLLKTGNRSRLFLCNVLIQRKAEIADLQSSTETGILEIITAS
jgi:predicted nuclease of predicted toxin-antitoxin system